MGAGQLEGALQESEERFRSLFENTPVSIWEEDFSKVKNCIDDLIREQHIDDFEAYLTQHPEVVSRCGGMVKILDANQAALKLHGAKSKKELLEHLAKTFTKESYETFSKVMVAIWRGEKQMEMDAVVYTISGMPRNIEVYWSVSPGHENSFSRVLVSLIDITKRKQAEEKLRELANIPGE
ncbi:MAG: PAS domain S-box protein, partial [Methanosarcinaceae archaeon]|nr:PAS domain S-box protein [Methanosarcinaceae archaeon]